MASDKDIAQNQKRIFADNLNYYLNLKGKTQLDLANELNVTTSTVSDWYNAKKYPRVNKMQRIADYLGILIVDLREKKEASATMSIAEAWSTILRDAFGREPNEAEIAWAMSLLKLACQKASEDI